MANTEFKKFADELGTKCIGDDFDLHLKKIHQIRNFELGRISVSSAGEKIEISLYEPAGKNYLIKFNTLCLAAPAYYNDLDRPNMWNIPEEQKLLRARLRVQSALLKLYKEKDAHKKNQVGRNLIYIELTFSGKLIWK